MRQDLQASSPFGELIGRTVLRADPQSGVVEVAYVARDEFSNRMGTIAGGMLAAMLDSVTGLAALVVLPAGEAAVHTALQVDYLKPARPGRLIGRGTVVERAARDMQSQGELSDAEGNVVARARATLRILVKTSG